MKSLARKLTNAGGNKPAHNEHPTRRKNTVTIKLIFNMVASFIK